MKEYYLVTKSRLFDDETEIITMFDDRKDAATFIEKCCDESANYGIKTVALHEKMDFSHIAVITKFSTIDGKYVKSCSTGFITTDEEVPGIDEEICILESSSEIIDDREVLVTTVSNKKLSNKMISDLIKKYYEENFSKLVQAKIYKAGDEVIYNNEKCYVTAFYESIRKVSIIYPSKIAGIVKTTEIIPTGKFSEKVAMFFDKENDIDAK